jgi:hypothetical protein
MTGDLSASAALRTAAMLKSLTMFMAGTPYPPASAGARTASSVDRTIKFTPSSRKPLIYSKKQFFA